MGENAPIITTSFHATTEQGRVLQVKLVRGYQTDTFTRVDVLGVCIRPDNVQYGFSGHFKITLDRSEPDFQFTRLDEALNLHKDDAADIFYAIYAILDQQQDGLLQQQERRLSGD